MKQEQKFLNFVPPYPVIFLLLQSTNSPQSVLAPELPHPKHKFSTVLSLPQGFLMFCHLDFSMYIYEGVFILPSGFSRLDFGRRQLPKFDCHLSSYK